MAVGITPEHRFRIVGSVRRDSSAPIRAQDRPPGPSVVDPRKLSGDVPYIPLIRTKTIERMPELLDRMNVSFEDLLRQVGLPQIPFDYNKNFLPLRDVLAVVERAARVTGIECFGLFLATAGGLDALEEYGRHIKAAPTVLEAIRRAGHYIGWHTLGARLSLMQEGSTCVWRYDLSRTVRLDRQHAYLFALVLMRDVVRLAAGPDWLPSELRLEQAVPIGYQGRLKQAFGEHINGGTGENALVFEQSLLVRPLPPAPIIEDAALTLTSNTPPAEFIGSLKQLIRSFLPAGSPSAALLAHTSALSVRSFQRALAFAGCTFSDLVDQVRFEMATEMMHDPRTRLIDIGLELGYSDAANFTRAFKRWTGQTPRQYRQALKRRPIRFPNSAPRPHSAPTFFDLGRNG